MNVAFALINFFNTKRIGILLSCCSLVMLSSCSVSKQISRQASGILLKDPAISSGHIGISIYEPASGSYWYNYDATKYFVPASNVKLFSLYAGMKYLGDSLVGLRYVKSKYNSAPNHAFYFAEPTGDPTFLHPDFTNQPVMDFFKTDSAADYQFNYQKTAFAAFGKGWAWDDYNEGYMAERSAFPIYGNEYTFYTSGQSVLSIPPGLRVQRLTCDVVTEFDFNEKRFTIKRNQFDNGLFAQPDTNLPLFSKTEIPFITSVRHSINLLRDTVKRSRISYVANLDGEKATQVIHSQPTDSLLKPMMHRSDNFFAEQTLLMASKELLGYMDDEKIIDTILKTDLKDIPQKPKWVDGSGLSRYNLFTPQSFIYLLNKMKNEFGLERMKNILPTGGEGTLSSYYKTSAGFIFAKTGTLSNNCALSGYLVTRKNKLLVFSIICNNYMTSAASVRKAVEQFLQTILAQY
ncbi:MAG: D-alanyl-D-alanine carboxypeptidase [Ferruginibacter sp.]